MISSIDSKAKDKMTQGLTHLIRPYRLLDVRLRSLGLGEAKRAETTLSAYFARRFCSPNTLPRSLVPGYRLKGLNGVNLCFFLSEISLWFNNMRRV